MDLGIKGLTVDEFDDVEGLEVDDVDLGSVPGDGDVVRPLEARPAGVPHVHQRNLVQVWSQSRFEESCHFSR